MNKDQALERLDQLEKEIPELKKILQSDTNKKKSVAELTTFEQCCEYEGTNPDDIIPFKDPKNKDQEALNALAMWIVIVRVNNEGWIQTILMTIR